MDYDLHLGTLSDQEGNFSELKSSADELVNDCNDLASTISNSNEISGLESSLTDASSKIENGYKSCNEWMSGYNTDINNTEDNLANFEGPVLNADFSNIFTKILVPALNGTKEGKEDIQFLGDIGASVINGFRVVDGNIIDTSKPIGKGERYGLSDDDLAILAYVAMREQGSIEGAKVELSLMANLYEKNKNRFSSVTDYVLHGNWFANNSMAGYSYPGDDYFNAAKEVLNDGNRYLASNVVEHDCINPPDIIYCSTGDVNDRSCYIPGETVLKNRYGATYVFVGFAPNGGDPFGYVI